MQLNLLKVDNCSDQDTQDLEEYIRQLYTYIKKKLQFKINPTIRLVGDAENSQNPLGQTGNYEPGTNTITVFITDRHTKDILRSICHELAHHNQNCNERISGHGGMQNGYAQNDEHLRTLEKEAYEASILLRDWEDEMKNDNEPLFESFFESLDDYREKRQSLITEAVYKKFGFSTQFIKEAGRKKSQAPDPKTTALPAPGGLSPELVAQNDRIANEIIIPGLNTITSLATEHYKTLSREEKLKNNHGYIKGRIRTIFETPFMELIKNNQGDIARPALVTIYHAIGTVLDHLNTQPDDQSTSSTARVVDKKAQRMQNWGLNALSIWADIQVVLLLTAIQMATRIMKLNPEYQKIPIVYRPEVSKVASLPEGSTSIETFQIAFGKVRAAVEANRQRKETAKATAQQPAPETDDAGADFDGDDEPLEETQRRKLSETRKNTLNTLRLLESLTKKGRR